MDYDKFQTKCYNLILEKENDLISKKNKLIQLVYNATPDSIEQMQLSESNQFKLSSGNYYIMKYYHPSFFGNETIKYIENICNAFITDGDVDWCNYTPSTYNEYSVFTIMIAEKRQKEDRL